MEKLRIRIWETHSLGLILIRETGVIVVNQTNGVACQQSEAEGIYVPLQTDAQEIEEFFAGYERLDNAAADFLDEYFRRDGHGNLRFLSVDRARLNESLEAWVYVNVAQPDGDPRLNLIQGFGKTGGILTWSNSD
jgi:hypothetical protein